MRARLRPLLAVALLSGPAMADPVWDPTEIARLSQQAAQMATNLSVTIDTLRTADKLIVQIGATGARSSFSSPAPAILARYSALSAGNVPPAADASALMSSGSLSLTQLSQRRLAWQAASQTVAAEGLALSQVANRDAAESMNRSKALASLASGTQDLRGDMQANSAVGLAVLSELGSIEAVLVLLLEQQSLKRLTTVANNGAGS